MFGGQAVQQHGVALQYGTEEIRHCPSLALNTCHVEDESHSRFAQSKARTALSQVQIQTLPTWLLGPCPAQNRRVSLPRASCP